MLFYNTYIGFFDLICCFCNEFRFAKTFIYIYLCIGSPDRVYIHIYSVFRSTIVLYRSILIMCSSILVTTDQI